MNQYDPYHLPHNELLTVHSQLSYALHKVLSFNMFLRLSSQDLPMLDDFHQRLVNSKQA